MAQLTKNFTSEEFTCKCGCGLFIHKPELILLAQTIRDAFGQPLRVNSGTRCQWNNAKAGGVVARKIYVPGKKTLDLSKYPRGAKGTAKDSNHTLGEAVDLSCFNLPVERLWTVIMELYNAGKIPMLGGFGRYHSSRFAHVDITKAANGRLRRWDE
jgi:uncharacterized protein YcbK (DUF882 family)